MLSQEYHEHICRMYCRILRRLEARKHENGQSDKTLNKLAGTTSVYSFPKEKTETKSSYQIYLCVSTLEQKKNTSTNMQQEKLCTTKCGWQDNSQSIIINSDDLRLSGQLRMEEHPTFVKMLRRIVSGEIKTAIASKSGLCETFKVKASLQLQTLHTSPDRVKGVQC